MNHFNFYRLTYMCEKYPYQNSDAEEAHGANKKMKEKMKIMEEKIEVYKIGKYIIGDLFNIEENGIITLNLKQDTNCLLCR